MRHLLRAGGLALLLVLATVLGTATPAAAQPVSESPAQRIAGGLLPVVDLSAQRVLVAASMWGTDQPIDDPARELAVLAAVAELARERGTEPDRVVAIFRDQIEGSKLVQRGLFRQWTRHPEQAPTERPDLDQVRAEINRLNVGIVDAVAGSERERDSLLCGVGVVLAEVRVDHEHDLDALHARALDRSVDSICG